MRELYVANARYWIDEFHFDGLRLDATQDIHDDGPDHVLAAVAARRARGGGRPGDHRDRARTSRSTCGW